MEPNMRNNSILLSLMAMLFFFIPLANAQVDMEGMHDFIQDTQIRITPHIGLTMPTGDFKSTTALHGGFAQPGPAFGVNLEARFAKIVTFGSDMMITINPMNQSEFTKQLRAASTVPFKSVETGSWTTVMVLLNFGLAPEYKPELQPFANLHLGLGFVGAGDYEIVYEENGAFSRTKSVPIGAGVGVLAGLGVGATFYKHLTLDVRYMIGTAALSPSDDMDDHEYDDRNFTQNLGYISMNLGYAFRLK
jgi:hypothetical protein